MTDPKILYKTIEELRLIVAQAGLEAAKQAEDHEMIQVWIGRIVEHQINLKDD